MSESTADPASKQLKRNAIGMLASVGVGVAATTPATGVALVFGLLAVGVGVRTPAVILLGFIPILLISTAYLHLNRVDPDCGTVFSWASRAFGPWVGWFGGWIVITTLAVVVTNFAQLLGMYSFLFVGANSAADSTFAVTVLGTVWFAVLTVVAYRGIELSKRVQLPLLAYELLVFVVFAVVAIVRSGIEHPSGSVSPSISWFDPSGLSTAALASGFVSAVLIYWGWDTSVMVNEESEHQTRNPGRAAVLSTLILLGFYVICSIGVLAWAGPARLAANPADILAPLGPEVLGGTLNHLLILAVLTSSIAGCIFLPIGGARTMLSMARQGALPPAVARIHPRFQTPSVATLVFAAISVVYYVVMTAISNSILTDSLTALGLLVAFYYALTGLSCVVYFRRQWRDGARATVMLGVAPLVGAVALLYVMVRNGIDLADPANSAGHTSWFGLGAPLVIALAIVALGILGAVASRLIAPAFFAKRAEAAPANTIEPVSARVSV